MPHYRSVMRFVSFCLSLFCVVCISLQSITAKAASNVTASMFNVYVSNTKFCQGSNAMTASSYLSNVCIERGESFNYFSGYIDVPISLRISPSSYDGEMYYGYYSFNLNFDISFAYSSGTGADTVYYHFGQPYTFDTHENISMHSAFYSTTSSVFDNGTISIGSGGTFTFSQKYAFRFDFRDLFLKKRSSISFTYFDYIVRIPFSLSSNGYNTMLTHSDFLVKCTPYSSVYNYLYYETDSSKWSTGSAGVIGDKINGTLQSGQEQAHADVQAAQEQAQAAQEQAHADAQAAQEQAHADAQAAQEQAQAAQEQAHADAEKASEERKNIFDKLADFFGSFFENLINGVKSLFVPSSDDLSAFLEEIKTFLDEHLGFLYLPIDLLFRFFDLFSADNERNTVITFPAFSIMGHKVWDAVEFDIVRDLIGYNSGIRRLFENIYFATDVLLLGLFIRLCINKLNSFMGGGEQ